MNATATVDETAVRAALRDIPDPEIPALSIVDLGIVHRVDIEAESIRVELLPTFVGCPALDVIRESVEEGLGEFGRQVEVRFDFRVPWTSERISAVGREALRRSGIAPPDEDTCPYCGSAEIVMDNLFGPTQCRALRYCRGCRQPFEAFKPI